MAHEIFISYAAEDKAIADAVCLAIESQQMKCWYAPRDVEYGKDFEESIVDAIAASRLVILILTSHANHSAHVKREIQNACVEEVAVPVLPFRTEDIPLNKSLRYYIGSVHWLDAVTPPLESHLKQLVEHVRERLPPAVKEEVASAPETPSTPPTEGAVQDESDGNDRKISDTEVSPEFSDDNVSRPKDERGNTPPGTTRVPNYLWPAVASIFCCVPMGIVALVYSAQANSRAAAGDTQSAIEKAKIAKIFLILALVMGAIALPIWSLQVASFISASKGSNPPPQSSPLATLSPSLKSTPTNSAPLSGLSVDIVYLAPQTNVAMVINNQLIQSGAKTKLYLRDDPVIFQPETHLYYYVETQENAQKVRRALMAVMDVNVAKNSSGSTPHSDGVEMFLWVGTKY